MNQPPSQTSTTPRHSATDCLGSDAAAPIAGTNAADACPPPTRTLLSQALFGNASEICIHHMGTDYRLRITRQGKLILTK